MAKSLKQRITETLLEKKLLTKEQLEKALQIQKKQGRALSQILVDLGFIETKEIISALSQALDIPTIKLSKFSIDPAIIETIPVKTARHYGIVPISKLGKTLTVAMADPLNVFAIDDITALTGYSVNIMLASAKEIGETIEQYYAKYTHQELEQAVEGMKSPDITTIEEQGRISTGDLKRMTEEMPVVKITNMILAEATQFGASDILIEPLENNTRVRYRIDGVLQEARILPRAIHDAVISRIKVMSELDISEHRLPQDGRFKLKMRDRFVDFRISVLPSSYGEKAGLRILDKSQATLDIEKLGFSQKAVEAMKSNAMRPHGMILICGPTGSGKTTTLYSILEYINTPEKNFITVEDPVEYDLAGINQVNVKTDIGLTFARTLRSMLRQDPDVIMVGEIRDYETADIAIKAALTGHLVLSTLHTNTAPGTVTRLINMGVEPFLISSSVAMVGAQRLVRKICSKCKESYMIDESVRKEFGITDSRQEFYHGKGCDVCFGTGYKGRVGIIEVVSLSPDIRNLIMDNALEYEVKKQARKEGMVTLREDGLDKAREGVTTLEEVIRVTVADKN